MIPLKTDYSEFWFADQIDYAYIGKPGLSEETVREISKLKNEPEWMLENRLRGLKFFLEKPMPQWGANLNNIDFNKIIFFARATDKKGKTWEEVPEKIKNTFEKLGIPEAERKFLAGVEAQYDSETVYGHVKQELEKLGVIFCDMDTAVRKYPDIVKKYFGTIIPAGDNKFASLNTAVWSGGSFVYVPKGVKVEFPLQAYFRINRANMGQFERTLIIAEEGSSVHYIEGCTAAQYSADALHAAVVEIIAEQGAYVRYTTLQNWSKDVYNLVTKRAHAHENATVEWVDANIGSQVTMKYPSVYLMGKNSKAEILSIAMATNGQHIDAGGKVLHFAPNTSSRIISKSISVDGGHTTYRGLLHVAKGAIDVKSNIRCDALLIGDKSRSDTFPYNEINEKDVSVGHEASVGKIGDDQIFYLMSRGLNEVEAVTLIVQGFLSPFTKELPLEYAVEFNRLISLEMEGSVG